ncbi:ribosomal protein L7/L12 [Streptosporangium sp. NPDC023963]|uniref:ribosomal protein L7/L12 n=1 Tax=Streptosporangium sp. NPDC023963 TaxID=3155608 RepID=UPI003440D91E
MPNLGPVELLIIAALLAVVLAIVVGAVMAARSGGRAVSGGRAPVAPLTPPTSQRLYETVTGLTRQGRKIQAIKELRQYTGLGLKESKAIVDAVAAGHDMWSHPLMSGFRPARPIVPPGAGAAGAAAVTGPDLATRVRELKAAGRAEQAVYLVRGETGMGEHEAELFVDTL